MTSYFVGVDVGGTFTDLVLGAIGRPVHVAKVVTTPEDPLTAVVEGVAQILRQARVDPADVTRLVHGTTLATNVILERRGGPVAFITTAGFGDLLRLGREARVEEDRFDLWFKPPEAPVSHRLTFEAAERISARGEVLTALSAAEPAAVAARVAAARPAAVAICLLNSYVNPAHEDALAEACRAALPEVFVVTSADVWPEMREYERAMTTVMCAYVGPVMAGYLHGLTGRLAELGLHCPVEIMDSSGGVMSAALAALRPVATVESGGAAGVTAAGFIGRLLGIDRVISLDMGGTTAKAGIVRDGRPLITHGFQVGGKGSFGGARPGTGFPLKIPAVDLAEVGAGGGSLAWVDAGGATHVGPQSAGSVPGPACYGRGGRRPTVTDANLILGYLNPDHLAGGVTLAPDLAVDALERFVAEPLGVELAVAAGVVHEVANARMAAAIRFVTIQRGVDPRDFTLVAFGGAGPMHAARLAATFGIERVAVPRAAGVASAVGLVTADLSVDHVRTLVMEETSLDLDAVNGAFAEIEARGRAELAAAKGGRVSVRRQADVRYRGQAHQLTLPVPSGTLTPAVLLAVVAEFRSRYREAFGVDVDGPAQLVSCRARVTRIVDKLEPAPHQPASGDGPVRTRPAWFAEAGGFVATPVLAWDHLGPGERFDGPAIVDGADTTVVVPPGFSAEVDGWGNVLLGQNEAAV